MKATHRYQNCMVSKRGTVVVLEEHVVKFYFEELHILIHFGLLECPFPVFLVSFGKGILSQDVPGQEFFPRFLLLPLFRDKGTAGQGNILSPGQRVVPSRIFLGRPVPW